MVLLKMKKIQLLVYVCTLFIVQPRHVCGVIEFLARHEGESVVFPCVAEHSDPPPVAVYLKRSWMHPDTVLFMYSNSKFSVQNPEDDERVDVSGDPSGHLLNVSLSQLKASDTDRYYCEFVVEKPSVDKFVPGKTEFFLHVAPDSPSAVDIVRLEACAGSSVVLPCSPPHGEASAVEGVSLKRQKGQAPVEVLYHSKQHHGASSPSSSFPLERVRLSTVPGPSSITYSLTLLQLQPEDSALYSCQLLLHGRAHGRAGLGRRVYFVSVQGGQCGCSSYTTLLYALSAAVAVLFLLLLVGFVMYRGKARQGVKPQTQAPIYEEMTGVQPLNRKLAPHHLEEMDVSEYKNCSVKKSCTENHYESPAAALSRAEQG